jgi:hypothetical protein
VQRLLLISLLGLGLAAQGPARIVKGRITDGQQPLPGVRVVEDQGPRTEPPVEPAWTLTDANGAFSLAVAGRPLRVVMEKEGWQRDFGVVADPDGDAAFVLRPAPRFRRENVLVVRLAFPDDEPALTEPALRRLLFSREPGVASAASYLYEVSKGSLLLEEGAFLTLRDPHLKPRSDHQRDAMITGVLKQLRKVNLKAFDQVNNRTGTLKPDGKPDHLWIIAPGPPRSVTNQDHHLKALCTLTPLPWNRKIRWPVVFATEEVPLGNLVHEAFHAMGEHRVDDFYLLDDPFTAGGWDLMDAGQYRGWDRHHPDDAGPWRTDTGYSPSQPMGWTRAELWYRGAFKATVTTVTVLEDQWSGWLDPLVTAPKAAAQRLLVPDSRKAGTYWEFNVRRPWGFDAGRVGHRWGPGYEGLVVARVDPSLLSRTDPRGPVRVIDAHPATPVPPSPRYPNRRWELDDAAFNLGPGEVATGQDGPLRWEVLAVDSEGRMQVRIRLGR